MEFRKMVPMILHAGQQRRHRHKEQSFRLIGKRQEWDNLREYHWNMYIAICKIDEQCKFNDWSKACKTCALGHPSGIRLGGRWEGYSRWRRHMYSCGQLMSMYGKNYHNVVIILQLKLVNLKNPNGKENEKEYICITESPCHASEINTTF